MVEKTISERLLLKAGRSLCLVNAPDGFADSMSPLPTFARIIAEVESADIVLTFVQDQNLLNQEIERLLGSVRDGGQLWLAYPRKNRNGVSEVDREYLKIYLNRTNWQAARMTSLNEKWVAVMVKRK
jgi:hypothetical protein